MSRQARRIQVTPSPEAMALLDELNKLTGTPRAAIVAEILDDVAPVFQSMIEALRIVQDKPLEAQRLLQNSANEALGKMAQAHLDLDAAIDGRTVKGKRKKAGGMSGRPT